RTRTSSTCPPTPTPTRASRPTPSSSTLSPTSSKRTADLPTALARGWDRRDRRSHPRRRPPGAAQPGRSADDPGTTRLTTTPCRLPRPHHHRTPHVPTPEPTPAPAAP